jgi:cellulose synthase/poly-beta-1,6-N-acetylglucosamine synthase-like glycosyltransferase
VLAPERQGREAARPYGSETDPSGWMGVLRRLDLSESQAASLARRAEIHGVAFQTELIASGLRREDEIFRAIAAELDVRYAASVDPGRILPGETDAVPLLRRPGGPQIVRQVDDEGPPQFLLAPDRVAFERLAGYVATRPSVRERLRIVRPSVLRAAILAREEAKLSHRAERALLEAQPGLSASTVLNAWQGALLGSCAVALPFALALWPMGTMLAIHALASIFFLACVVLRIAAALGARPPVPGDITRFEASELPRYCVLVALYKEAPIVPDLLVALSRIVWPRSKLEIKLICEADDTDTLAALASQTLRPWTEIIKVPPGGPRTKPKALSFALPATSADFVVLYDAEDRPHPLQLIEAWQKFEASDARLACLQAPLHVANPRAGVIARLFSFEYAALFRGLLPFLARKGSFLPLGGTSNHFRREALEAVTAWDPHNVTEDADLGLRLARFGYRSDMIGFPTREDAPETVSAWLPQRARWQKGWVQTWLVHMRDPAALLREVGARSFLAVQVLSLGMVASALVHPLFVVTALVLAGMFAAGYDPGAAGMFLLGFDVFNLLLGYAAFLLLGWRTLARGERGGFAITAALTPFYWMLMSLAAWQAIWQLYARPHHWNKTPHAPSRRPPRGARAAATGKGPVIPPPKGRPDPRL